MKKVVVLLMVISILCGTLLGCVPKSESSSSSTDAGKPLVALLMPDKELPIWIAQGRELQKAFEAAGYKTTLEFAEGVVERQLSQIENATLQGAKYIVIASVDPYAVSDAVEKAKKAGAMIIADDRLIMNTEAVDYYITFDLEYLGTMIGQYVETKLGLDKGEKGPFNMEIFSGSPDDPNAQLFYKGKMGVLQKYIDSGVIVVKSGQVSFDVTATMRWDTATAQARMDNLLSAYYADDLVDIVLCSNDSTALGVINSLASLGYGSEDRPFPVVTGQDSELTAIKAIRNGQQAMTIFLDPAKLAEKALNLINAVEAGETPKTDRTYNNGVIDVPATQYDLLTIDANNWQVVIERGFYSEADFN